ncbi:MAG: hypothetical protein JWN10_1398, partial [Solirubrobacterales bacterium]|nr:hypothetical protein [Solirubrobacterales bacterium]
MTSSDADALALGAGAAGAAGATGGTLTAAG